MRVRPLFPHARLPFVLTLSRGAPMRRLGFLPDFNFRPPPPGAQCRPHNKGDIQFRLLLLRASVFARRRRDCPLRAAAPGILLHFRKVPRAACPFAGKRRLFGAAARLFCVRSPDGRFDATPGFLLVDGLHLPRPPRFFYKYESAAVSGF